MSRKVDVPFVPLQPAARLQQAQQIVKHRSRVITFKHADEVADVNDIVTLHKVRWDLRKDVYISESDVLWEPLLWWTLVETDV